MLCALSICVERVGVFTHSRSTSKHVVHATWMIQNEQYFNSKDVCFYKHTWFENGEWLYFVHFSHILMENHFCDKKKEKEEKGKIVQLVLVG